MSIAQRISTTWERDGLSGIALRTAVFTLRRLGRRADKWSSELDYKLARKNVLRRYSSLLNRNEQFRNCHRGKPCFVIGNGPSLKQQDLAPLAGEITYVTNYFNRHPIVSEHWQPTYYCLSDPAFFDGREPIELLKEIALEVPQSTFFVPHNAFEFLKESEAVPLDRTYYIAPTEGLSENFIRVPDLTEPTPGVQTVVQLAIMAAIFMGCSPIYLLGLDHDWLTHGGTHVNFYSQENVEDQPDGNLPGWSYHAMMDAVLMMWKIYELHSRMAEAAGVKIINCTDGGFLDVFPRMSYETVVAHKLTTQSSSLTSLL